MVTLGIFLVADGGILPSPPHPAHDARGLVIIRQQFGHLRHLELSRDRKRKARIRKTGAVRCGRAVGKAWVFRNGKWVQTNGASVGVEARPMSEEAFRGKFGELPAPPTIFAY